MMLSLLKSSTYHNDERTAHVCLLNEVDFLCLLEHRVLFNAPRTDEHKEEPDPFKVEAKAVAHVHAIAGGLDAFHLRHQAKREHTRGNGGQRGRHTGKRDEPHLVLAAKHHENERDERENG
ncbi:hypothetical protein H257_16370 [Aphanomyces astaci]|uniref:Uncharacterized protein n=1 Tax=Aphanomyces astaci TaxID=112090 RepID=W4FL17_APHAT|nr:hypothetical protein H257_16370 [Aphanomyces astaci]ETV67524.1 hypothetical protein H257_16370 [Aphanomyces astaci]|eukprot:XP_009843083.1 hypothetical protein H257_16370 [Aphanomyces astaci]